MILKPILTAALACLTLVGEFLSPVLPVVPFTAGGAVQAVQNERPGPDMPTLSEFSQSLKNSPAGLAGIYIPGILAYPIAQQPADNPGFVSTKADLVTQFKLASQYNSIGLLAHNYLAGASFPLITLGQVIILINGNGSLSYYQVDDLQKHQAVTPTSPTSRFINLDSGKNISAEELFFLTYGTGNHLILQTCISKDQIPSWGRLFILAHPILPPAPSIEKITRIIPGILRSTRQMLINFW